MCYVQLVWYWCTVLVCSAVYSPVSDRCPMVRGSTAVFVVIVGEGESCLPLDVLTVCLTEQHCRLFTQQCHNDGFVTLVDDQCSCLCPAGLDPSTGCATTIKQGRWCVYLLVTRLSVSVCVPLVRIPVLAVPPQSNRVGDVSVVW